MHSEKLLDPDPQKLNAALQKMNADPQKINAALQKKNADPQKMNVEPQNRAGNSLISSFAQIAQIKLATVSNSLRLLRTNERL